MRDLDYLGLVEGVLDVLTHRLKVLICLFVAVYGTYTLQKRLSDLHWTKAYAITLLGGVALWFFVSMYQQNIVINLANIVSLIVPMLIGTYAARPRQSMM